MHDPKIYLEIMLPGREKGVGDEGGKLPFHGGFEVSQFLEQNIQHNFITCSI
jgi:hypothetical protein